ncbi:hypothetical protein DFS33DRAFT_1298454 [Desarmillaria ectypa]|nr:hypothetical protein DFS33DRAFT_1298454 [Desarmillaria ectypa]
MAQRDGYDILSFSSDFDAETSVLNSLHTSHSAKKVVPWHSFRHIQTTWFSIRSFCLSQWIVITRAHPWTIFLCILLAYMCWAGTLKIWIVDMDFYYYKLLQSFHQSPPYEPRINYDPLGFGQLLAATVAIEPIYAVCLLIWKRRADLESYIKRLPSAFWDGIVFIVSGRGNPWRIMHAPLQDISPQEKPPLSTAKGTRLPPNIHPHRAPAPSSTRHAAQHHGRTKSYSRSGRVSSSNAPAQTPIPYRSLPTSRHTRDGRHRHARHNSDRYLPAVDSHAPSHGGPSNAPLPTPYRPSVSSHHREKPSVTAYDPPLY